VLVRVLVRLDTRLLMRVMWTTMRVPHPWARVPPTDPPDALGLRTAESSVSLHTPGQHPQSHVDLLVRVLLLQLQLRLPAVGGEETRKVTAASGHGGTVEGTEKRTGSVDVLVSVAADHMASNAREVVEAAALLLSSDPFGRRMWARFTCRKTRENPPDGPCACVFCF